MGSAIIAIGLYFLITSLGLQIMEIDDTYAIGEFTSYEFEAPKSSHQFLKITGETFDVSVKTPSNGLQVPKTQHKNEVSFDWYVLEDGTNRIEIQNTGQKELHVTGTLQFLTKPLIISYHVMVMIAGIVILGFSAGFSFKKPKGF